MSRRLSVFQRRIDVGLSPTTLDLLFEHVRVVARQDRFDLVPAAEFTVDVAAGTVKEVTLDPSLPVREPIAGSPLHESARPGSYAPLKS